MRKITNTAIVFFFILPLISIQPLTSSNQNHAYSNLINNQDNINLISEGEFSPEISDKIIKPQKFQNKVNQNELNFFFTRNLGQINIDNVKFYIQGQRVWFTPSSVVFELVEQSKVNNSYFDKFKIPVRAPEDIQQENELRKSVVVTFDFVNSNNVLPTGEEELSHKSNFFYGNNSSYWYTNVPNYQAILYKNIYDNIDLRYYFNKGGLKYDFIVNSGGDPNDIAIKVSGAEELILDYPSPESMILDTSTHRHFDSLTIKTGLDDIVDSDLFVYQENDGKLLEVSTEFILINSDCYGFRILDEYDYHKPLIIDPLIYSTYIGGGGAETVNDIKIDEQGNVYITGGTSSSNFPVKIGSNDTTYNGDTDIFVTKLNSDGTQLLYSTFIGGDSNDVAYGIEIDSNRSVYICGRTYSDDFPTTSGAYNETFNGNIAFFPDVILSKLTPEGDKLNFSTYIGSDYNDVAWDLTLDDNDNIYITGSADEGYPTTPGVYKSTSIAEGNVFITKLNTTGTDIIYSTLIGTTSWDYGGSIALDNDNNICITGLTMSSTFPTTPGAYRETSSSGGGYLLKLNANMSTLLYSTFVGQTGLAYAYDFQDILFDNQDNIIIAVNTLVTDYPTTPDAYDPTYNGNRDVLILKFKPNLSALLYATYFGGKENESVQHSILDHEGNIIFTGGTDSSDLPTLEGVHDTSYNGNGDAYVTKINITDSQLRYSTYIGGSNRDYGWSIGRDENGTIYIGGYAEQGFPTTPGSYSPAHNGGVYDAFVLKLKPTSSTIVIDLNVSESIVFRSQTIGVYSNAIDIEDDEEQIRPHFGYKHAFSSTKWTDNGLSVPKYLNDRWQTNFSVPINATLGDYDLRVRYNDTDDLWSRWYYLNDSLLVLNNPPQVEYFNLSKNKVVICEELSLLVNGSDVEDSFHELSFQLYYKYSTATIWYDLNYDRLDFNGHYLEYTFAFGPEMDYGLYDFRVLVNDSDNDLSEWSYLLESLLLLPAPPNVLTIELSKDKIYRTESFDIFINCTDPDSLDEEVFVELQYMAVLENLWYNISADLYGTLWESYVNSKKTWILGNYSFRARAIDFEDNISPWFYLNDSFKVLNNIPELKDIDDIPVRLDRTHSFDIRINATDKENSEDLLLIALEYKLPGEKNWIQDYLAELSYNDLDKSWYCKFTLPYNAPIGKYSFRARACDLDDAWNSYVYRNDSLWVNNSIPKVLTFDQMPKELFRTESVSLIAMAEDLETATEYLQCTLFYQEPKSDTWQELSVLYNASIMTWYAILVTTKTFVLGNYSFYIQFRDDEGALSERVYANEAVWVQNNPPVISNELDDINVGSTQQILKLTDYGYDVETSKGQLKWEVDYSTVNTKLFHIESENIAGHEIIIYPVQDKNSQDDITIILIDADGDQAIKYNITIIVDSRVEGKPGQSEEDIVSKFVSSNFNWIILLIIILIVIMIIVFALYRRKKQKEEETQKVAEEAEKTQLEAPVEELPPVGDTEAPSLEGVAPEPVPVIDEPSEPATVPMPVPAEKPALPPVSEQPMVQTEDQPDTQPPSPEPEPVPQPQEAEVQEQQPHADDPEIASEQGVVQPTPSVPEVQESEQPEAPKPNFKNRETGT